MVRERLPPWPPALGSRFLGVQLLGRGGFGAVVEAEDRELGRRVAIKLLDSSGEDDRRRQRFLREARLTAGVGHPGVVQVYDFGGGTGPDEQAFIVYELVEGRDLERVRREDGEPGEEQLRGWAREGAEALAAVHRAGLVHRDVKPGNVLLRADGRLVLCDFGLALPEEGSRLTATGLILGTPDFMAPEIWRGERATVASDQFAWAASLTWLAGAPVYPGGGPGEILRWLEGRKQVGIPEGLRDRLPSLAVPLDRALRVDPEARFASMEEMARILSGSVGETARTTVVLPGGSQPGRETGVTDPTPSPISPPSHPKPRRLRWMAGGLGVLGLLVALGGRTGGGPAARSGPPPVSEASASWGSPRERMARARVRRGWDRILLHLSGEHRVPGIAALSLQGGSEDFQRRLASPELVGLWREALQATVDWCGTGNTGRPLSPELAEEREVALLWERVSHEAVGVIEAFRKVLGSFQEVLREFRGELRSQGIREPLRLNRRQIGTIGEEMLGKLCLLPGTNLRELESFKVLLAAWLDSDRQVAVLREALDLVDRYQDQGHGKDLIPLVETLVREIRQRDRRTPLPCETHIRLVETVARVVDGTGGVTELGILSEGLDGYLAVEGSCGRDFGVVLAEGFLRQHLERLVVLLEAGATLEGTPRQEFYLDLIAHLGRAVVLEKRSPELTALGRRLEELVRQAPGGGSGE